MCLLNFAIPGQNVKDAEENKTTVTRKEKSGGEPIIVPIVLKMAEFEHKV